MWEELDPNILVDKILPAFQLLRKRVWNNEKVDTTDLSNVKDESVDWFILNDGKLAIIFSKQFGAKESDL
jgi:hypothetical protein